MPETTENAPETKTETCPKKGCKDCGCWVCIAPYLMAGIIFLACWWIFFYLSCGGGQQHAGYHITRRYRVWLWSGRRPYRGDISPALLPDYSQP